MPKRQRQRHEKDTNSDKATIDKQEKRLCTTVESLLRESLNIPRASPYQVPFPLNPELALEALHILAQRAELDDQ